MNLHRLRSTMKFVDAKRKNSSVCWRCLCTTRAGDRTGIHTGVGAEVGAEAAATLVPAQQTVQRALRAPGLPHLLHPQQPHQRSLEEAAM